jgi:hypothetical protein
MDCDRTDELNQDLASVRTKLQDAPTSELRHEEDRLTTVLFDHKISHNSGLIENCKKK